MEASYVIVARDQMKEFFNAPEEILSFKAALAEALQFKHIGLRHFPETLPRIIRTQLTQHIPILMNDVVEELDSALNEVIVAADGTRTVCRALAYTQIGHLLSPMKWP